MNNQSYSDLLDTHWVLIYADVYLIHADIGAIEINTEILLIMQGFWKRNS